MITHDVDEAVLLSDRIVMMTNGPAATIGEVLDIELGRPRERLVLADDPRYNHYRSEVLKFLYERQKRPGEDPPAATPAPDDEATATPGSEKPVENVNLRVVSVN
jgi:nitrate/nitrite transport system ATP-binding protein